MLKSIDLQQVWHLIETIDCTSIYLSISTPYLLQSFRLNYSRSVKVNNHTYLRLQQQNITINWINNKVPCQPHYVLHSVSVSNIHTKICWKYLNLYF